MSASGDNFSQRQQAIREATGKGLVIAVVLITLANVAIFSLAGALDYDAGKVFLVFDLGFGLVFFIWLTVTSQRAVRRIAQDRNATD